MTFLVRLRDPPASRSEGYESNKTFLQTAFSSFLNILICTYSRTPIYLEDKFPPI